MLAATRAGRLQIQDLEDESPQILFGSASKPDHEDEFVVTVPTPGQASTKGINIPTQGISNKR